MAKNEIEIKIIGEKNTGIILNGDQCFSGDIATVDLSTAKNLVHRGRAVIYTEEAKKAEKAALAAEDKKNKSNKDDPGEGK